MELIVIVKPVAETELETLQNIILHDKGWCSPNVKGERQRFTVSGLKQTLGGLSNVAIVTMGILMQ